MPRCRCPARPSPSRPGSSGATGASIGSRWRWLNPGQQALLVLAYLRKGETFTELAAGFGVGVTTAWRWVTETVALLAARAPKHRTAVRDATRAGLMPLAECPQGRSSKFPAWLTLKFIAVGYGVSRIVSACRSGSLTLAAAGGRLGDEGDGLAAALAGRLGREAVCRPRRRWGWQDGVGRRGDAGCGDERTRDVAGRVLAAWPAPAGLAAGLVPAVLAAGAAVLLPRGGGGDVRVHLHGDREERPGGPRSGRAPMLSGGKPKSHPRTGRRRARRPVPGRAREREQSGSDVGAVRAWTLIVSSLDCLRRDWTHGGTTRIHEYLSCDRMTLMPGSPYHHRSFGALIRGDP